MSAGPVYVTQPSLPPLDEFMPYLEQIWNNKQLTNCGPFHQQLEDELCKYLGVEHIALFANGTLALVSALQALDIKGEVITTPYSFVATAHALLWNGLKPVFADVDAETFNLDPARIEQAITPQTTAILPVHCYGRPCDVEAIQAVADKHNLRVIYDAAHAFGVSDRQGDSILRYGDLSILSFHATKVFNTFEGGAIICPDAQTKQRVDHLKNFGFSDETVVVAPGINGKMNEVQAAFGLLGLKHYEVASTRRREIDRAYRAALQSVPGISCPNVQAEHHPNFGYFPILVEQEFPLDRDQLYMALRKQEIYARRYFYPLISDFPMYRNLPSAAQENLLVARSISDRVICLPIYPALTQAAIEKVVQVIAWAARPRA